MGGCFVICRNLRHLRHLRHMPFLFTSLFLALCCLYLLLYICKPPIDTHETPQPPTTSRKFYLGGCLCRFVSLFHLCCLCHLRRCVTYLVCVVVSYVALTSIVSSISFVSLVCYCIFAKPPTTFFLSLFVSLFRCVVVGCRSFVSLCCCFVIMFANIIQRLQRIT